MTALEAAIVVAIVGGCVGAAATYQVQVIRRTKELALRADLQGLRAAVEMFQAKRRHYPASLEELVAQPLGAARQPGGHGWSLKEQGQGLVDVFGRAYAYEPSAGVVRSRTPGYETW